MPLAWAAGQVLTASEMNSRQPLYVTKTATQSVTSSTTYVDDAELFLDLLPNRTYEVQVQLSVTGSSDADIKLQWSWASDITTIVKRANRGPSINTLDVSGTSAASATSCVVRASSATSLGATSTSYGLDAGSVASDVVEQFVVSTGLIGGRLQLKWAQRTSIATATVVGVDSYLVARPVA